MLVLSLFDRGEWLGRPEERNESRPLDRGGAASGPCRQVLDNSVPHRVADRCEGHWLSFRYGDEVSGESRAESVSQNSPAYNANSTNSASTANVTKVRTSQRGGPEMGSVIP